MSTPPPPAAKDADAGPAEGLGRTCGSCGAPLVWNAATHGLACPYCGAKAEVSAGPAPIVEHPMQEGFAKDAERGLGVDVKSLRCESCGATISLQGELTAKRCDFCGSSRVLPQQENRHLIRPESLVPFAVPAASAQARFRGWLGSLWFRPSDLKAQSQVIALSGLYVPFWTFDSQVHSVWTAQAGYVSWVSVSGRVQRSVRWVPAAGSRDDFFDDVLQCASRGLTPELAAKLHQFDTKKLVPYDPSYLAGFRAEEYAIGLRDAWAAARIQMSQKQTERCGHDVPGDTSRFLSVTDTFTNPTWKHVLLPVWVAAYQYRGRTFQFLVNGQTGELAGRAPWSWAKVTFATLAGILAIALAAVIANR